MNEHLRAAMVDTYRAHRAFAPVRRVSVAQGASDALVIRQPGGYSGPWSPDEAPYMVEPMNMCASREHEAVIFVGPARTGKTMALLDGFIAYAVTCDPGDTLIVHMSQEKAREYSKVRIDRAIRHSPALRAYMTDARHTDNTFDKAFTHGMWLKIGWPTITQLSGSDYRNVLVTDYDRMPEDVDGEGSVFAQALKRTQTFLSRGMCAVESSPGRDILDPRWRQTAAHEAPPTTGILSIYNRSNRKRWYWPCPHCGTYFEATPGLGLFALPSESELIEMVREADLEALARQYSRILCPAPECGAFAEPEHKHGMNRAGRWLAPGQYVSPEGEVCGDVTRTPIAGYWLGGVAAAYQSWSSLVLRYLQALREYATTNNETNLRSTVILDQGAPYLSRHTLASAEGLDGPEARKEPDMERFLVPSWARLLIAAVDVQGGQASRFVVQVHAIGVDGEQAPIDRYAITKSARDGMDGDFAPLDPASYPEDWDAITAKVVAATYRTPLPGKEMRVRLAVVDTGGEGGVSNNAYAWYRRIRTAGLASRVMLIKGASNPGAPLVKETLVGARRAGEKGDVPLYLLNPNLLKDMVDNALHRTVPGPGFFHIPGWLPKAWFDELRAEVRDPRGVWMQIHKRNETLDLCYYIRAGMMRLGLDLDRMDWENAPAWARPLEFNSEVMSREARQDMKAEFAPAPSTTPNTERRTVRSSYVA